MSNAAYKTIGSPAPPLALAATTLIWGYACELLWLGIIIASIIEAPRLLSGLKLQRWVFNDTTQWRIWSLSIALMIFTFLISLLNPDDKTALSFFLLQWSPLCLLPMALMQRYSSASGIPFKTLIFFKSYVKGGRVTSAITHIYQFALHMDLPYLLLLLCASAATKPEGGWYYIACSLICCYLLVHNPHQPRLRRSIPLLLIIPFVGFLTHSGIHNLQLLLQSKLSSLAAGGEFYSTNKAETSMGEIGESQNSPSVVWKLTVDQGNAPQYLRTALFNRYKNAIWLNKDHNSFSQLPTALLDGDNAVSHFKISDLTPSASLTLQGKRSRDITYLGLPAGTAWLHFPEGGRLDKNGFGSMRLSKSEASVADFSVDFHPEARQLPPPDENDLNIPEELLPGLDHAIAQAGLSAQLSARNNLIRLENYFTKHFSYSTWQKKRSTTPLHDFLTKTFTGHCEFFASSSALILRRLGIPSRYAVGFIVNEGDGTSYLIRGIHAHAWIEVYYNNAWQTADFTPVSAAADLQQKLGFMQPVSDFFSTLPLRFHRWGRNTTLRDWINTLLWILIPLTILATIWQIYKKGGIKQSGAQIASPTQGGDSPFYTLIKQLEKSIPPRQTHETIALWLRKHRALLSPDTTTKLLDALQLHNAYRFDPSAKIDLDELSLDAKAISTILKQHDPQRANLHS